MGLDDYSQYHNMLEVSKVKPWINEDIFKSWTDAQKRLWESLCSAVPCQPPAGVEAWRETYLRNLAAWESAVKKTLQQEASWVEQWVHKVAHEQGTPEVMATWVQQMEDVLQRWIRTQNQWWDEYFAVLRRGGVAYPDWAGPQAPSSAEPAVTKKPARSPKPQAKAASTPPVADPAATAEPVPPPKPPVVQTTPDHQIEKPAKPIPTVPSAPIEPDDLKLISGIGPALEKKLNACGISRYQELATLSDADIDRVEASIKSFGRIRRDNWIGQAKTRHFEKYQVQI